MQRRCPYALPEVERLDAMAQHLPPEHQALLGQVTSNALPYLTRVEAAQALHGQTQHRRLRLRLREVIRLLKERQITQERDKRPVGTGNPNLCRWFGAMGRPEARWLSLVRFGGWGEPLPMGLDPMEDPARYVDAAAVITAARNKARAAAKGEQE